MTTVNDKRSMRRLTGINITRGPQRKVVNVMRLAISISIFFSFTIVFISFVISSDLRVNVWAMNSGIFTYFYDFDYK